MTEKPNNILFRNKHHIMPDLKETTGELEFIEKKLQGNEPDRCVDGRQDTMSKQGAQMPGGSLFPITIEAIANNRILNEELLNTHLQTLKGNNVKPGFHRGSHQSREKNVCDCGFCDRLSQIVKTAKTRKEEITQRIISVYQEHGIDTTSLSATYDVFDAFKLNNVQMAGERIILAAEKSGAHVELAQGDHAEEVAFVNLKKRTTFDTQKANSQNKQAFNLDLWKAIEEAQILGVDPKFARDASVILYQATEMVLVEDKGKPALSVKIHQ